MRYGYYGGWDSTYFLVVIGAVICLIASARVKSTFHKYSGRRNASNLTGAQAAERVLYRAGIFDVSIRHVSGNLTDHYDPRNKTLNLSDSVYGSASVAAVVRTCDPASAKIRSFDLAERDCAGCEFRIYFGMAPYCVRAFVFKQYRIAFVESWDSLLFFCSAFSACHASRGI